MLMTSFVYQLSQHKAAQARVLQEIDAFGRHRDVKYEDLDQFPYMEVRTMRTGGMLLSGFCRACSGVMQLELRGFVVCC